MDKITKKVLFTIFCFLCVAGAIYWSPWGIADFHDFFQWLLCIIIAALATRLGFYIWWK